MVLKNVIYGNRPDNVIVTVRGRNALVEIPTDVTEHTDERDGETAAEYIAGTVYAVQTLATANLKARVEDNINEWITLAKQTAPVEATIPDLVEAINVLTEIVLGGSY